MTIPSLTHAFQSTVLLVREDSSQGLGAFSSTDATTAARFQFQCEACLGAGPDGKEKKKISLILCDEGILLPTPRT